MTEKLIIHIIAYVLVLKYFIMKYLRIMMQLINQPEIKETVVKECYIYVGTTMIYQTYLDDTTELTFRDIRGLPKDVKIIINFKG